MVQTQIQKWLNYSSSLKTNSLIPKSRTNCPNVTVRPTATLSLHKLWQLVPCFYSSCCPNEGRQRSTYPWTHLCHNNCLQRCGRVSGVFSYTTSFGGLGGGGQMRIYTVKIAKFVYHLNMEMILLHLKLCVIFTDKIKNLAFFTV
jgi:hypothetical protein